LNRDLGETERAILACRRSLFLSFKPVDTPDEEKNGKGHDQEINDRIDEQANIHG